MNLIKWGKDRAKNVGNVASKAYDQVNVLDNNRTWEQRTPTNQKSAVQQAGQVGAQSARGMFGATAKTANTGLAALNVGNELRKTAQASVFGSDKDYSNAVANMMKNNNRYIQQGSGVLGKGSWFKDKNEATNIGTKDLAGRIVGAGAETYLEGKSLKMGGFAGKKLLEEGIKNGIKTQLPTIAKNMAVNSLQGGVATANQGGNLKDIAKGAAIGGSIGTAADIGLGIAGAGASKVLTPAVNRIKSVAAPKPSDISPRLRPNQVVRDTQKLTAVNELRQQLTVGNRDATRSNAVLPIIHKLKNENGIDLVTGSNADRLRRTTQFLENNGEALANPRPMSMLERAKAKVTPLGNSGSAQVGGPLIPIPKKLIDKLSGDAPVGKTDPVFRRRQLIEAADMASKTLNEFTSPFKGEMGLIPKEVMDSLDYKTLSRAYQEARNNLGTFNKLYSKDKNVQKAFREESISRRRVASNMANPELPSRSQSPLRASMSEDEFFQRFNPGVRASESLDGSASLNAPASRPVLPSIKTIQKGQVQTPQLRKQITVEASQSLPNRTPRQLEIKESTAPFSNEQAKLVKDYADMLRYMGEGNGVTMNKATGQRISNNVRTASTQGQSRVDWMAEAETQLRSGKAEPEIQKAFRDLEDPEFRSLAQSAEGATAKGSVGDKFTTDPLEGVGQKIKQQSRESNIPVRKLTQDGDVVTATNVNSNIKAGEKRYSVDKDTGELVPDTNGATSLFTDGEGRVKGFRIGNETFSAKQLGDLSDVNGYGSSMATMRRNIERGFGKETGAKVNEFLVDHQQGQATRMIERHLKLKQGLQQQADALGINFGGKTKLAKEVSAAIQDFGEKKIDKAQLVERYGKDYAEKIAGADKWFKAQYDTLLNEMNDTLTKFGYDPVPKRANYYTHFTEPGLWENFGLRMQEVKNLANPTLQDSMPDASRGLISNKLAGQSEFTLPNKKFNKFALRRKGDAHTADAFKSFETYLNPTLNNIYMTPSIARARVLTRAIAQDADIVGKDANHIIVQTKEWANRLAGKSNRFDRPFADTAGGQLYLKANNWVQRQAGANTIVGNLSTAVMQPILLAQTAGKSGYKNTILAAMQEMSSAHSKNAPIRQSEFLRRRYTDLSPVTAGKVDRLADIANTPLNVVEETAARISWNAAHNDALSQGLKGKQAIKYADVQTEKTLAGRSIGERPELYESKIATPFTMYQLEVNNFMQQFGREMTKKQAAKTMVAAYALNLVLQQATGRQVGFNPIDAVIDSYKETQKEEKSGLDKAKTIAQRLGGEVVDNTPLVAPAMNLFLGDQRTKNILGKDSNVGRFGVGSPLSAAFSTTNVGGIPVPQNVILPFGGGQLKKTYEGAQTLLNGGIDNKEGERQVDVPRSPQNIAKGLMFGKGAIPEVGAYYDNIGRKKADQSIVPNQKSSVAGGQSLDGLTKDQQELYGALPQDKKADYLKAFQSENKVSRQVEKEVKDFEKSNGTSLQRSDGKYAKVIDGKVETFDSEADYNKKQAKKEAKKKVDAFKSSSEKMKVIDGRVYQKKKNGDVFDKPVVEYEYDKSASTRKLNMDRASEANNLDAWAKGASEEFDALEKLKTQYDPETEQDKIDGLTLKQENLADKLNGYLEKGYIRKGKGRGGKGKKPPIDLVLKAGTATTPLKARKSNMSVRAPSIPSFNKVKTPRVASRPRNRSNVTSTRTRIS